MVHATPVENTSSAQPTQAPPINPTPEQLKRADQLQAQGFSKDIAFTHFDFVDALFRSCAIYKMVAFRNSTSTGKENHDIRVSGTGEPCVKVEGNWVPVSEFQKIIMLDPVSEEYVSRNNQQEGWNYVSPLGFVCKERINFKTLYPIEQISPEELTRLRQHANTYFETNVDKEPNVAKDHVFQLTYTMPTDVFGLPQPKTWWGKNLNNCGPHMGMRVITPKGEVYSFGFQIDPMQAECLLKGVPFNLLGTVRGTFATPDYADARPFVDKSVTSIPITSEKAKKVLDYVSNLNTENLRFNYIKQNCAKVTSSVLGELGLKFDTRVTFFEWLSRIMPSVADIPVIGKPLHWTIEAVKTVAKAVFTAFEFLVPPIIFKPVVWLVGTASAVVGKVARVITTFILTFGGATRLNDKPSDGKERTDDRDVHWHARIISSPLDYFKDRTSEVFHPGVILEWQKQQKSTVHYKFNGKTSLFLVPETAG